MSFFDHKDLGNHLLQLCPKVVKHPVLWFKENWDVELYLEYLSEGLLYVIIHKIQTYVR